MFMQGYILYITLLCWDGEGGKWPLGEKVKNEDLGEREEKKIASQTA